MNTCVAKRESGVEDVRMGTEVGMQAQAQRTTLGPAGGQQTRSALVFTLCRTAGLEGWAVTGLRCVNPRSAWQFVTVARGNSTDDIVSQRVHAAQRVQMQIPGPSTAR